MKPEKQLYQWDINQYLIGINPAAQYVDYTIENEVIRLETDGTRCRIPDEVLQTYGGKTCYERYPDGTYRAYSFTVLYAPKPPDYVYTAEERTTFDALVAKADAAIDEIKRRADSGEFTPVKGVDYFTDAEKAEMMENVSTGAIGEFRKVVDTATTEYNDNASEKLTTYDTNAEQHTTDYNRNAAEKLEAYNSNHAAKVAEYNQNAETKTAEFDANAAALQTEVDRLRAEKANVDGYYEEMTVGDAEQLVSTQFVEDSEPYLLRPTGGSSDVGNRAYLDKIVGGTVAWNQIFENTKTNSFGVTITNNSDGSMTLNGTTTKTYINIDPISSENFIGHKYMLVLNIIDNPDNIEFSYEHLNQLFATTPKAIRGIQGVIYSQNITRGKSRGFTGFSIGTVFNNVRVCIMEHDLTQMFGSTIADYIYSLEQSQTGAGVAWFKKLFPKDYYEYNAGELISVEGLQSHDTVGFNQWDEEWEVGGINHSTGENNTVADVIRSTNYVRCLPSTTYYFANLSHAGSTYIHYYDANKNFISYVEVLRNTTFTTPSNVHYIRFNMDTGYGVTYKNDICVNLSDPSRNGEYEPYEKHSYPLDNSLTLRGMPKLDSSNNLYYDGDEYTSDGTVTRKYGVVVIDENANIALTTNVPSSGTGFMIRHVITDVKKDHYISNLYSPTRSDESISNMTVGQFKVYANDSAGRVVVIDSVSTLDDFKAKLKQTPLSIVYELATTTTETAEPYNEIQICDDFGTEEFVSTGIVPVGHNTRYPANLRDKLQHLPSLASADGTYLIQQSGKQMSLIHMPAVFPEVPTEDGTYMLKTVVTGGVATLQWVTE